MPQKEARDEAIRRAVEGLAADLAAESAADPGAVGRRCARLALPAPTYPRAADAGPSGGWIDFPLFGSPARLDLSSLSLTDAAGAERSQTDRILFYHYFSSQGVLAPGPVSSGEFISFRDLTGGAFYWEPFRSRTCLPLVKRYGADLPGLGAALARFDWEPLALGDFGARVHGMGSLYLSLVAWAAEEGIEAEINVLFDPAMKRVFEAEDAAAFASRICMGLL